MPRRGLSADLVIADAAGLADEVGLPAVTMAAVAGRLGVTLPALYKHVDGLAGLHRGIALLGLRELTAELAAAATGRSGADALHRLAVAYRAYATLRPACCAASVRAPAADDAEHQAKAEDAVAVLRSALSAYALNGADLVHAIRSLRVVLHGLTSLEAAGGFGLPQSVAETQRRLIDGLDAALAAQRRPTRRRA